MKWIYKLIYEIWTGEKYIENIINPSYTHFYYNALGEEVKCIILREEEKKIKVLNENKIRVTLKRKDVETR
tara:strand:- start:418 stop:630 length:213 start_codon:yes stop_codon:yes gene_type:complete